MAVLGKNDCTPVRIYGPLSQHLFMGCSVKSFDVSAGWNEQASNLTVQVVQDPCAAPRIYWDENLNRQEATIADPGFQKVDPGTPVYFRIEEEPGTSSPGGFEYCGLVQSWTESFDSNGNPQYTVQVTDPRVVLQNTQVIVNNFPGTTSGVFNLINAYGYVESLGTSCPSSPAGAIGGVTFSNTLGLIANERGMLWNDVKCAIHTLASSTNVALAKSYYNGYLRENRIVYVGASPSEDGFGVLKADGQLTDAAFQTIPNANLYASTYLVDLSEIPFAPNYYRISGPNVSLMEIISQVCADAGCDYYIELLPVKNAGSVIKIIKVRVAVRSSQPQMGKLDEYIAAKQAEASNANGGVLNYQKGEEVRNEDTSIFLMGGENRDPYTIDNTSIYPFFGYDNDGNLITATTSGGEIVVRLDARRLNESLYTSITTSPWLNVKESELRAALGDIDTWKHVCLINGGDTASHFVAIKQAKFIDVGKIEKLAEGKLPAHALYIPNIQLTSDDLDPNNSSAKDMTKIYDFVRSFADEFYGKQYIASASFICAATDPTSGRARYSHEPSTEGCWVTDGTTTVLGLAHNTAASDYFRAEDGKYQAIVRFPLNNGSTYAGGGTLAIDPSKLGDDNYITDGTTTLWAKADIEGKVQYGNPFFPSSGPGVIVKIGAAAVNRTSRDTGGTDGVDQAQAGIDSLGDIAGNAGLGVPTIAVIDRSALTASMIGSAITPNGMLVPIWNHVQVYGPWGVAGLPGQVRLETDDGLNPWEFGSDTLMYLAAIDKVSSAVTQMRKGERGTVTVAGFPNIPLGAELFSVDSNTPPNSMGNQKYVETRTYNVQQCAPILPYAVCPMNAWTGEFGPNVTNVNVGVGAQGFTTQYQFSTYTPRFGRFNKDNAERLKRIGQQRLQNARNRRANTALARQIASSAARLRQRVEDQVGRSARAPGSAHHMMIGRFTEESLRNEGFTMNAKEATLTFSTDDAYSKSAVMSMDGLVRPVSKAGDGSLPRFANFTDDACAGTKNRTVAPDGPYNEYDNFDITRTYLDPLANPNDTLQTDLSDVAGTGHDVEILGRGTSAPPSGWAIAEGEEAGQGGYESDYRFFALRGPLVIQAWGYDTDGKPIPNKADSDASAEAGTFTTSNLEDKFLDAWLKKPKTWPVAPLDLRLDRERGVWTVPPPPRILHVTPQTCPKPSAATSDVDNGQTVYDDSGTEVLSPTVNVEWPWDIAPPTGVGKIPTYYDTADCKYYAFPANRLDFKHTPYGGSANTYRDVKLLELKSTNHPEKITVTDDSSDPCNYTITVDFDLAAGSGTASGETGCGETHIGWENWTGCFNDFNDVGAVDCWKDGIDQLLGGNQLTVGCTGNKIVTCLSLGRGLFVTTGDYIGNQTTCGTDNAYFQTATVSAYQFIQDVGGCEKLSQIEGGDEPSGLCKPYVLLQMGSGLRVTELADGCVYRIDNHVWASGRPINTPCDITDVGADVVENLSESIIKFDGWLSSTYDADECRFTVSGLQTPINYINSDWCSADASQKDIALPLTDIVFSTGLKVAYWQSLPGCTGVVYSTQLVSGIDNCNNPSHSDVYGYPHILAVGTGLTLKLDPSIVDATASGEYENCIFRIDSDFTVSGCTNPCRGTDDAECQDAGESAAKVGTRFIHFGTGMRVILPDEDDVMNPVPENQLCGIYVDAPQYITASGYCTAGAGPDRKHVVHTVFSGLLVEEHYNNDEGCKYLVSNRQFIEDDGDCLNESVVAHQFFEKLTFSTGLKVVGSNCDFTIIGGMPMKKDGCGNGDTTNWVRYSNLIVGSGLSLRTDSDVGDCVGVIEHVITCGGGAVLDGQTINCGEIAGKTCPYPASTNCIPSSITGPYPDRGIPTSLTNLWSGPGIGFATEDNSCLWAIFNNHTDQGFDDECNSVNGVQIHNHDYSNDFMLELGGNPAGGGGAIDGSDWSQSTKISLSDKTGGTVHQDIMAVTGISCTSADGYLTSITLLGIEFDLYESCGDKWWVKNPAVGITKTCSA